MDAATITQSLEIAAERRGDLTSIIYARLFTRFPQMEPLFIRDSDGSVRGEMLARTFEAILDFIGARAYAGHLIQREVVTHEGYGVPPEVFGRFFEAVADTLRAVIGADWTPAMESAWRRLLVELDWFATHPDQNAAVHGA